MRFVLSSPENARAGPFAPVICETVLRTIEYHHPIFTTETVLARERHGEIDGVNGVHFCGAYWGYGFHEDGVKSALAVLQSFAREDAA